MKNVEPLTNDFYVVGARAFFVRESLPELGGEEESRIGGDALEPLRRESGLEWVVKRSIDFDRVEVFREVGCLMKRARAWRGVNNTLPIGIGPSRGPDADVRCFTKAFTFAFHSPSIIFVPKS